MTKEQLKAYEILFDALPDIEQIGHDIRIKYVGKVRYTMTESTFCMTIVDFEPQVVLYATLDY